jgi:hypothetical protein
MKRLTLGSILFLLLSIWVVAATDPPPQISLSGSEDVVLAKVDSVTDRTIAFSITEVLKGKSHGPLVLKPGIIEALKPGDRCILCYGSGGASNKGTISETFLDGIPEWLCMPVRMKDGKATVEGVGSLERVKQLCVSKSSQ